jgi:hypothetical protein
MIGDITDEIKKYEKVIIFLKSKVENAKIKDGELFISTRKFLKELKKIENGGIEIHKIFKDFLEIYGIRG